MLPSEQGLFVSVLQPHGPMSGLWLAGWPLAHLFVRPNVSVADL